MSMRRSRALSIDGVHDSTWIRRETEEAQRESDSLRDAGQQYLDDMDRLLAVIDAIDDADIDQDEADESRAELERMLEEAQEQVETEVVSPMEANEERLLQLQEMAEEAVDEHEEITRGVDTANEVTGFGIVDVIRDIDREGEALSDAASEAASALDLQIKQAETLRREARMRSLRGGRS